MAGCLVEIMPWSPAAGARVTLRVGASLNSQTLGVGGLNWESALARLPSYSQELVDEDLTAQLKVGSGSLAISIPNIQAVAEPHNLQFPGAPIKVYVGDGAVLTDLVLEFDGRVKSGGHDVNTGIAVLNFEVDRAPLDVPLLSLEYTGGGGIEGQAENRGSLKPAGFGRPINIPLNFIDTVNNVAQIDAYGNTISVTKLYEDGAEFTASFGDYATYATLIAASIPAGRWATCIASGLIRLGAPPQGVITCDPVFGFDRPGSMMQRWLEAHAGIAIGKIVTSDFTALSAAVDSVCGRTVYVSHWSDGGDNVLDLIQKMCASCNAMPLLTLAGKIAVTRIVGGSEALTLQRRGGTPMVTAWRTGDPTTPWWKAKMTAARTYRVHAGSEIDFVDDIRPMGDYAAGATYRQGMVVRQPADNIHYIWINATPGFGFAPPNATYWAIYEDSPDASSLTYASGATIESLKPAMAGATKNVTTYSASAPGSPTDGDLWVDTSGTYAIFKLRASGVWQTGSNALTVYNTLSGKPIALADINTTESNKLTGIATGATKNTTTYSASAPGSPTDGDIWVDTSLTPNVTKLRAGGVWQASANLVTQGTHIGLPNNAGSSVSLTDISTSGTGKLVGNSFIWNGTGSSWTVAALDASYYPTSAVVGRFSVGNAAMIGLTSIASPTANFNQLDYGLYPQGTALPYQIYEGGNVALTTSLTPVVGDLCAVVNDGSAVRYYVNGVLIHTSTKAPTNKKFRAMICLAGGGFSDIQVSAIPSAIDTSLGNLGANLIYNGDGELGTGANWELVEGDPTTFDASTTQKESGQYSLHINKTSTAAGTARGCKAIAVQPGQKFRIRVWVYASSATGSGLYIRINEKSSRPDGTYNGAVGVGIRSSFTDLIGNGAFNNGATVYDFVYTVPAGMFFISPALYNYGNGPLDCWFEYAMVRTVDWAYGLDGNGKPDPFATSADSMVANGALATGSEQWLLANGAYRSVATTGPVGAHFIFPAGSSGLAYVNNYSHIPLNGAAKLYVSGKAYRQGTVSAGSLYAVVAWLKADGTGSSITSSSFIDTIAGIAVDTWIPFSTSFTPPSDAVSCTIYWQSTQVSGFAGGAYLRVAKTEPAADVTAQSQVAIEIITVRTITADYLHAITGTLPVVFSPIVRRGATSIKIADTTTYVISGVVGGTVAVDNVAASSTKGDVSFSAMSADSTYAILTVTVDGIAQAPIGLRLDKTIGAAPSGGGSGSTVQTVSATQNVNSATFSQAHYATPPSLTLASGHKLYGSYTDGYIMSGNSTQTRALTVKHQYASAVGGPWTDVAAEVTGSNATGTVNLGAPDYETDGPYPGTVTCNQNISLSAGTYFMRTVYHCGATGRTVTPNGANITYEAKP